MLGCEIFSGSVDAVVARNWLKTVSDILTDMKLDNELKLVLEYTKSLYMLDMLSGSSEERILVEVVELEIQVVFEILVVVGDYGV